jgi:hypothetical protein
MIIPGLQRNGANIFLIFISPNEVEFSQPIIDPWYNSSQTALVWDFTSPNDNNTMQV